MDRLELLLVLAAVVLVMVSHLSRQSDGGDKRTPHSVLLFWNRL